MLTRLAEAYRKLRNTFRYAWRTFTTSIRARRWSAGDGLERSTPGCWLRTAEVLERVAQAYDDFAFHKVYRTLYDFATVDLSAFYFDVLKDRLYTAPAKSARRRAAQTVLYRIADALVRAVAPLICFTADEIWSHLPALPDGAPREPSVHMATFHAAEKLREGFPRSTWQRSKTGRSWPPFAAKS